MVLGSLVMTSASGVAFGSRSIMSRSVKMPVRRPSSVIKAAPTLQSRMAQAVS